MGLQKVVDMITFPAPSSSYSLTSHLDELFFINDPLQELLPIPCMYIGCPTKNAMFVLSCAKVSYSYNAVMHYKFFSESKSALQILFLMLRKFVKHSYEYGTFEMHAS